MSDHTIAYVFNLHAAGGAFGQNISDRTVFESLFQTFRYPGREVVVFLLHPERSGQAAAAGLQVGDFDAAQLLQQFDSRRSIGRRVQMTRHMIRILVSYWFCRRFEFLLLMQTQ